MGTNDFQIWGMSCVHGKKRSDLKDFRKYTEWIDEKRKMLEDEREQMKRLLRAASYSDDRKPFRRGGSPRRRSSRANSPGSRNYRRSPSPRDRRSSSSVSKRNSPSPPRRREHSKKKRDHSKTSERKYSKMRKGSPVYDSSPRDHGGSSSPYGDRKSWSPPPRKGTPEYTSALSSRNRTAPLSYGEPKRSSYSSSRR